jgi:hypothetical protein
VPDFFKTSLKSILVLLVSVGACHALGDTHERAAFRGVNVGEPFDLAQARASFPGLKCAFDRTLSSIQHESVEGCDAVTDVYGQKVDLRIYIGRHRVVESILLAWEPADSWEGTAGMSVDEMEERLIGDYGFPDVLRSESPRRPNDSRGLIVQEHDHGEDVWDLGNGTSLTLGPGMGEQRPSGHVISSELITFSSHSRVAGTAHGP